MFSGCWYPPLPHKETQTTQIHDYSKYTNTQHKYKVFSWHIDSGIHLCHTRKSKQHLRVGHSAEGHHGAKNLVSACFLESIELCFMWGKHQNTQLCYGARVTVVKWKNHWFLIKLFVLWNWWRFSKVLIGLILILYILSPDPSKGTKTNQHWSLIIVSTLLSLLAFLASAALNLPLWPPRLPLALA